MSWRMFFIRLIEIVVAINIVVLDLLALQSFQQFRAGSSSQVQTSQVITPTDTPTPTIIPFSPTPIITTVLQQAPAAKEIFIPLGTGQNSSSDWADISGAEVSIDSTKYPGIKQVIFEAAISVPTANETVWVRLFNATDGHPVWFSEMNMGGASQFLTSQPIVLDTGDKTYQVQMKTQLQYPANLTESRIHITLQ